MLFSNFSLVSTARKTSTGVTDLFINKKVCIETGNSQPKVSHLLYLDGLRALCALYVLMHHSSTQIKDGSGSLYNVFHKVFSKGHFAVDVFIVLSGFCLMLPVVKHNNTLKDKATVFFKKRVRRILPTYYYAMALSLILIFTLIGEKTGTHWDVSIPVTGRDILAHIFLIQDIFNETCATINHAFWSISVEWRIYFLFPLLIMSYSKFGAVKTTIVTLIASVFLWGVLNYFTSLNTTPSGINPHYIGLFCLGMLSAHLSYSQAYKYKVSNKVTFLAIASVVLIIMAFFLDTNKWNLWIFADICIGISCFCFLITLASGKLSKINSFLSWKPIAFIGTFAYSIYLIHAPLLAVFSVYVIDVFNLSATMSVILFVLVAAPLIVGLCYLFFLVAEKPFITKKVTK